RLKIVHRTRAMFSTQARTKVRKTSGVIQFWNALEIPSIISKLIQPKGLSPNNRPMQHAEKSGELSGKTVGRYADFRCDSASLTA
ncbi:hypothetical protein ACFPID_08450, partial [Bifidobacterium leontopitheci]